MKKFLSLILATCLLATTAFMASCGSSDNSSDSGKPDPDVEFDGWTPDNILQRPVEKDDIRIGTYVAFADTATQLSGKDQVERYYYAGLNFMPMICTLPKSGILDDNEKTYISRDLTDSKWWGKIDELMLEYNMTYYFSELSGLANDHESSGRRESMINDNAVADARSIIPNLKNCVGVKIVDEPAKELWADMLKAVKIVKEYARPFINFLPFFDEDFEKTLGTNHAGYAKMLEDAVKETGLRQICYDCYFQMFENNREEGIGYYFHNLNEYRMLSEKTGVDFWTTLLSVGHWAFRVPTEDDIRWQISTACAHGAKSIFWFYIYGRLLESSYRQSPFDQYYNKTATFDALARQMRLFNDHFADRLAGAKLLEVYHAGKTYGGTPLYTPGCIEGLFFRRAWGMPMIVSKFVDENGKEFLLFVNNSQDKIERIEGEYKGKKLFNWFAPGQMLIVEE